MSFAYNKQINPENMLAILKLRLSSSLVSHYQPCHVDYIQHLDAARIYAREINVQSYTVSRDYFAYHIWDNSHLLDFQSLCVHSACGNFNFQQPKAE